MCWGAGPGRIPGPTNAVKSGKGSGVGAGLWEERPGLGINN